MAKKHQRKTAGRSNQSSPSKTEVTFSALKLDFGIGEVAPHAENMLKNALNAIRQGVGAWYAPVRRVREAKADRVVANEQARAILDLTRKQVELRELRKRFGANQSSLADRAMARLLDETCRTQANREQIAQNFLEYLSAHPPEKDASIAISDEWLTQFWEIAEKSAHQRFKPFMLVFLRGMSKLQALPVQSRLACSRH
jgi:hypothetical protein